MAGTDEQGTAAYTLPDRKRSEVTALFARFDLDQDMTAPPYEVVERAIQNYIDTVTKTKKCDDVKGSDLASETVIRQSALVEKIENLSDELLSTLNDYISENDHAPGIEDTYFRTIPGLLALENDRSALSSYDRLKADERDALEIEVSAEAYSQAVETVEHLREAARKWLAHRVRQKPGKPRSENDILISELQGAVYQLLISDHQALKAFSDKPSAPTGPLCQLTEIVFEALGKTKSKNLPQLVRRSMAYLDAEHEAMEEGMRLYDLHVERKCERNTCEFCS